MENSEVAIRREDALLSQAIEKGLDTETLEKLIALRNAEIARQAKATFDEKFAQMQAEFTPVGKTNTANSADGRKLYSYCPIEVILMMAAPILAKHGFAYSWEEESLPSKEKRVWCVISGHGHERRGFVDIPFMDPVTKATNAVQMRGSATTYGKRYSFLNATGIIVSGEDNDALSNSNPAAVKVEVVHDEPEPEKAPDPLYAIRAEIKDEINQFVQVSSSVFEDKPYFTDAEKADFKAKIAAINEGAKAMGPEEGLKAKLADLKTLNRAIGEELATRQGKTDLAKAMTDALRAKSAGAEQKELY